MALDVTSRLDVGGRRALVTGAAHGLGLAIASAFVGAGMRVGLLDADGPALAEVAGRLAAHGDVAWRAADVTDEPALGTAVDALLEHLGGLDALVNDAAVYPTSAFTDMPTSEFAHVLDVNVLGYARMARLTLPALAAGEPGAVVNLSSITFFLGIPPGLSAYITSKGAVIGLTRALARELGPDGVRVNSIAPGAIPTAAEEIVEDRAAYDTQIIASQCLKRRASVADVAGATLFLASPAAGFITGQTLAVDGGWTFG